MPWLVVVFCMPIYDWNKGIRYIHSVIVDKWMLTSTDTVKTNVALLFGIASDDFVWNQSYLIMVFAWSSTSLVMQLACLASFGKHTVTLTGQSSSGQVLVLLKYRFTVFLPYKLYSTNQYIHLDNSLCSNKYICQEKVQPTIGVVEYWGNKKES